MNKNVLIIGLGSIARKHINALNKVQPGSKIYALRNSKNASAEEGVINIYDKEEIPDAIQFGIISSPTNHHLDALDILLERKIPSFIEKPIFHKLENCYPYEKKIDDLGIFTYVACNLRFLNSLKFLKEYLKTNTERINEVNVYCGSYMPEWRSKEPIRNYSFFEAMGGGVHLDLFHELDYCAWLFGYPVTNRNILRSVSSIDIEAIDYANMNLIYKEFNCNITLNYYRRTPKRTMEIVFENQILNVDLFNNSISDINGDIIFSDIEQRIIDTYTDQMNYFIQALSKNDLPQNNFRESLKILELCLLNNETI